MCVVLLQCQSDVVVRYESNMVKHESGLLLILVTVLVRRTATPKSVGSAESTNHTTNTVFDDVDDPVLSKNSEGEEEQKKNDLTGYKCHYETDRSKFFLLSCNRAFHGFERSSTTHVMFYDTLGKWRFSDKYKEHSCCYNKISRYKYTQPYKDKDGSYRPFFKEIRCLRTKVDYNFHAMLTLAPFAKRHISTMLKNSSVCHYTKYVCNKTYFSAISTSYFRAMTCHYYCQTRYATHKLIAGFRDITKIRNCLHLNFLLILLYIFVIPMCRHEHVIRINVDLSIRTTSFINGIFSINANYFKRSIRNVVKHIMYYDSYDLPIRNFDDLLESPQISFYKRCPQCFPQTITVLPITGSLNVYLKRVQDEGSVSLNEEMCYEVRRLQSFNSVSIQTSRCRLALSGFYATGSGDETRCYSCGMRHRNWQLMDKPDQVHRSLSPGCPHLTTGDPRNVPISSTPGDSGDRVVGVLEEYPQIVNSDTASQQMSSLATSFSDFATPLLNRDSQTSHAAPLPATASVSSSTLHLDISKAVYPQFNNIQSRMESFQTWTYSHVQEPSVLAMAGFYYAGYRDCVRCFYCGVGLRTWEKEDDPWVIHVRWRSSCDYIRETKGEQFIIQALTHNPISSSIPSQPTAVVSTSDSQQPSTSQDTKDNVTKAEEMGFTRGLIEQAMNDLVTSTSGDVQLEELIEKLVLLTTSNTSTPSLMSGADLQAASATPDESSLPRNQYGAEAQSSNNFESSSSITRAKAVANDFDQNRVRVLSPEEERQLEEENQSLREEGTCKICMDNPSCIVFLPCGHLVTCAECAPALRKCPICRTLIKGTVRAHTVRR